MKKIIAILITGFAVLNANTLSAQSTLMPGIGSNGEATAHIIIPVEINKNTDLAFGNIAAGTTEGTVVISVNDERSGYGGVTLIAAGSVSQAASFSVYGFPNASFSVSLPGSVILEYNGYQLTADEFLSNLGSIAVLDEQGVAEMKVGATLHVLSNQQPGLYSGTFEVTVAYN